MLLNWGSTEMVRLYTKSMSSQKEDNIANHVIDVHGRATPRKTANSKRHSVINAKRKDISSQRAVPIHMETNDDF